MSAPLARFTRDRHSGRALTTDESEALRAALFSAVERRFGVSQQQIEATHRNTAISFARRICAYLLATHTRLRYLHISQLTGTHSHKNVCYSMQSIRDIMANYPTDREQITALAEELFGPLTTEH